jgi:hypothetical protein
VGGEGARVSRVRGAVEARSSPRAMVMACARERERCPRRRLCATPTSRATSVNAGPCGVSCLIMVPRGLHRSLAPLALPHPRTRLPHLVDQHLWQCCVAPGLIHSRPEGLISALSGVSHQPGRSGLRSRASPPAIWLAVRPSSVGRVIVACAPRCSNPPAHAHAATRS